MQVRKPWAATKQGIAFTKKCFAAASVGGLCYELLPNTVLLPFNRVRQEEAMQARLRLKDIPYQVQEYVRRVIDDLKFTEDQRKALSVYLTDLNDVGTYGNVNTIFGTLVKLPYMLWNHYPIPEEIKGKAEGEHPEATKQFHESLQWSDKAKLYLTAYQVAWTTRYPFLSQGVFNAVGILSAYTSCYLMTSSKNRITDKVAPALLLNLIILGFFGTTWLWATDLTNCENEEQIIKEVCGLGSIYAEGAVELYTKMQQHNKAIRELVGFAGEVRYTAEGDTRTHFRRPTIPLSERLAIVEAIAENYHNGNQISDVEKEASKKEVDKKEENKRATDEKREEKK